MRNHVQLADAYYRLSDEERKYGESASITNQRTIVREYCEKHGIILVEEFADDGYSGGNFERPGFRAMLEHLKTGKVNMVITKDLSRLGRDMTESSHYAERYFPEHGIRYLAPGSNFDSEEDNLMAPCSAPWPSGRYSLLGLNGITSGQPRATQRATAPIG